jgi:hypothetical protein
MTEDQIRALIQKTLAEMLAAGALVPKQEERAMTRAEFWTAEHMSSSTYHKMRKAGLGPDEVQLPGMAFTRITAKARREWHARMEEFRKSRAAQLERERRSELARARRPQKAQTTYRSNVRKPRHLTGDERDGSRRQHSPHVISAN